jgi:hypothetical protein
MFVQLKEYPDYVVTDEGEVISLVLRHGTSGKRIPRWRVLKPGLSAGYWRVSLGKANPIRVHSLVMAAFIGPCPPGLVINHKNGIKTDNRLENLEYCTRAENNRHAWFSGLCDTTREANTGENNGSAKISAVQAAQVLALKGAVFQREAAAQFGISKTQVQAIWSGRKWKHLQK